jgi:hypothetical protein
MAPSNRHIFPTTTKVGHFDPAYEFGRSEMALSRVKSHGYHQFRIGSGVDLFICLHGPDFFMLF